MCSNYNLSLKPGNRNTLNIYDQIKNIHLKVHSTTPKVKKLCCEKGPFASPAW